MHALTSSPRTAARDERRNGSRPAPVIAACGPRAARPAESCPPPLPRYLSETYAWAYLRPLALRVFDHPWVVSAILWGNYGRLKSLVFDELRKGQHALQAACVYGDFTPRLAERLGPEGRLDVIDVAPIQVANCAAKLERLPWASVRLADAEAPGGAAYDVVCCFFLLHELPDGHKRAVVESLLEAVKVGGKVVFVDYHRPRRWHPLRALMGWVFDRLEPFARTLWHEEIRALAPAPERFVWRKQTAFGGLYQKVVATREA